MAHTDVSSQKVLQLAIPWRDSWRVQPGCYFSQACHMVNHSFQILCSPIQIYARETAETFLLLRLLQDLNHQPGPTCPSCWSPDCSCHHAMPRSPLCFAVAPNPGRKKTGGLRVSWKPQPELRSTFGKHQATQRLQPCPHKPQKFSHAKTSQVPKQLM